MTNTAKIVGIVLGCVAALLLAALLFFRKRIYIWWLVVSTKQDKELQQKLETLKNKPSYKKSEYLQRVLQKALQNINPATALE